MKKICIMAMILAILLSVSAVAMAEEDPLSLSDANVQAGQTVYLTLKLNTAVTGDTMGVSYTYDRNVLEPVVSSCSWSKKGSMSDFNREDDGVWASDKPQNLMGDICVLAFRVKSDAELTDTSVSCTLVIKNGSQEQGTYTAQAKVGSQCEHSYGSWENGGEIAHVKTCQYCGAKMTSPHSMGSGVPTENPDDPDHDWLIYSCEICDYARQVEMPKQQKEESNGPTHYTQEATEPPKSEGNSTPNSTAPTEKPTETVPTAPPNRNDKETEGSTESTQPFRSDTSTPPKTEHTQTIGDGADENSQATIPPEQTRPADGHEDSNHQGTSPNTPADKDNGSSAKPEASGNGTENNKNEDSSVKGNKDSEQSQNGENTSGTNPTTGASYPDNSSGVITQSDREKVETNPAPTHPASESTTPYKDYNEPPAETTEPNVPAVKIEDLPAGTDDSDTKDEIYTNDGNSAWIAVVVVVILGVAIGGAVVYLKKKRK